MDYAGNPLSTVQSVVTMSDAAEPMITEATYLDNDDNGKIDAFGFAFSEEITDVSTLANNDLIFVDDGDFNGAAFGTSTTDLVTTSRTNLEVILETEATAVDTAEDSGLLEIATQNNFLLEDATTVQNNTLGSFSLNFIDAADPVAASVYPADGFTSAPVTSNIDVTFSEEMATTFDEGTEFTVTPDPGTFVTSWSNGNTTVTLNPDTNLQELTSYNVILDDAEITSDNGEGLLLTGPEDGDWTFTTRSASSGGGGGGGGGPATFTTTVLSPNGGEDFAPGEVVNIEWKTGGTGTTSFVDILFSADGGSSYTKIADNESNDGLFSWIVSDLATAQARIKIEGTDLASTLSSDASDANFSIGGVVAPPQGDVLGDTSGGEAPGSGVMGPSPFTGEDEEISVVSPGDYIKSPNFSTVYYVDSEMIRHPFLDTQTFFTYEASFDVVTTVTDATLPTLPLGVAMLPKHGIALVKIQSMNQVYAVQLNSFYQYTPIIRHIETEAVAAQIYGADWADYVIDIPPFTFPWFEIGDPIDSTNDIMVNMSLMKTRAELNS